MGDNLPMQRLEWKNPRYLVRGLHRSRNPNVGEPGAFGAPWRDGIGKGNSMSCDEVHYVDVGCCITTVWTWVGGMNPTKQSTSRVRSLVAAGACLADTCLWLLT